MIEISERIDWLSVTFDSFDMDYWKSLFLGRSKPIKSPIPVYKYAVEFEPYGVKLLWGDKRLGDHMIISGKPLDLMYMDGITELGLYNAIVSQNGKIGRCDIAVDIFNSGLSVSDFMRDDIVTSLKGKRFIGTEETGIETLYLGDNRSKSRRFRIYNKGIEQQWQIPDWIRIEYEKRRNAHKLAEHVVGHGKGAIVSTINSVLNYSNWDKYTEIMGTEALPVKRGYAKSDTSYDDRERWLVESVVSAMIKQLKVDGGNGAKSLYDTRMMRLIMSELGSRLGDKYLSIDKVRE